MDILFLNIDKEQNRIIEQYVSDLLW